MRPLPLSRKAWCQPIARRHITTRPATFANIKYELLNRPPRTWRDRVQISGQSKSSQLRYAIPGLDFLTIPGHVNVNSSHKHNVLPQGHHLLYFPSHHHTSVLLPDGTDADHSPGPPFFRRVWSAGTVKFAKDWEHHLQTSRDHATCAMTCRETVVDARLLGVPAPAAPAAPGQSGSDRTPGAGEKIFVDVKREYRHIHVEKPLIVELRTLCFMAPKTAEEITRDLAQASHKKVRRFPLKPDHSRSFTLTPAALFRFSALTFNAHRIHFDPQYCREVEGYPDLLVHGPLLLMLMFSVLTDRGLLVKELRYRNLAPVFVGEKIKVRLRKTHDHKYDVWIIGPADDLRVKGTATLEDRAEAEDLRTPGSTGVAGAASGANTPEPDATSEMDHPHCGSGKTSSNSTDRLASDHHRDNITTLRNEIIELGRSTAKEPNKGREAWGSRNSSTHPKDTTTAPTAGSSPPAATGRLHTPIVAQAGGENLRSPIGLRGMERIPTRHERSQLAAKAAKGLSELERIRQRSPASTPDREKSRGPSARSPHSALQQAIDDLATAAESDARAAPALFRRVLGPFKKSEDLERSTYSASEHRRPQQSESGVMGNAKALRDRRPDYPSSRERVRTPLESRSEDLSPADGAQKVVNQTKVTGNRQAENFPPAPDGAARKAGDAPEAGITKLARYLRSWIS